MRSWQALIASAALWAAPVLAEAPRLVQPVDCELDSDCYIQNYVDRAPEDGIARDVMCSTLTYDGHKGTDFALLSHTQMKRGVNVRAAASGIVRGTRDEMPDIGWKPEFEGRDCGNGLVLDHGNGWQTQYCHMKLGTVQVRKGDRVAAGDVLGQVGYSGKTEFPHLHLSLRHKGRVVDPFEPSGNAACGIQEETLWGADVGYTGGGLVALGFSASVPKFDAIKAGEADEPSLAADAGALVLWSYVFGAQKGDVLELVITGPEGFSFRHRALFEENQAAAFRAAGKRRKSELWPEGLYSGTTRLMRQGQLLAERTTYMTVIVTQ